MAFKICSLLLGPFLSRSAARRPAPAARQVNCYLSKGAVSVAPGTALIAALHPLN